MRLCVLTVGRSDPGWADAAVQDYARRIQRHVKIETDSVKAERFRGDVNEVKRVESERLLARLSGRDRLVLLDERGDDLDTEAFTELIRSCRTQSVHRVVFGLGGAYGHDVSAREAAWRVVRLSSLVLNHEVARVVLYEQIYRAYSILSGSPYHH